eukprot:SAG11_NODE_1279_length_5314_cov_3.403835_8_plen_128_part_00
MTFGGVQVHFGRPWWGDRGEPAGGVEVRTKLCRLWRVPAAARGGTSALKARCERGCNSTARNSGKFSTVLIHKTHRRTYVVNNVLEVPWPASPSARGRACVLGGPRPGRRAFAAERGGAAVNNWSVR